MSVNTLDLEKNTFNGEPILQIINTDNIETKENKQFDDSKPSVNFISFEFKKFIDGYRNMSTGSNSNSDINIIPIESSFFYKKQYSDFYNKIEQQRQLEQAQQAEQMEQERQKEIIDLNSQMSILKSDINSLETQNTPETQMQLQNKRFELRELESRLQMLQYQPQIYQQQTDKISMNDSNIIFLDKNIKNNNKPFMNIICLLSKDNERKIPDYLSTIFIYVSNGFSFPNLNIIGDRKKFYKIGNIFTVVPYIDSNNQLLYKPLTQLIESCPTCPTCQTCPTCPASESCPTCETCPTCPASESCPTCETCPTCPAREICPVLDKRPYIICLASCGALIIILICILVYTKSKQ
jgi:hypothetical protein